MKRGLIAILVVASVSCGELTRQGTASSYLSIETLEAASGASPGEFGGGLASDVVTVVAGTPTVFPDLARVSFALLLKDPGGPGSPTSPSPNNAITVNRYRVQYIRADGRNTPGVDVPFPFDGAFTVTVFDRASASFTLVRVQAKSEAPLAALTNNLTTISTIAEVTFYGYDQTGREVITTGRVSVNFSNFGDPN
ncbi:MAG: hypothetical protein H0U19_09030 [Acidobacteria bacterium]|nr:hypothetical protein [Acidobacteriota bacterium]